MPYILKEVDELGKGFILNWKRDAVLTEKKIKVQLDFYS